MKSIFAKWFFSRAIDEEKASSRFVKNHFEKSDSFRKWAKDMASVDEQLKIGVSSANHKPSPRLLKRTMDALHENAFTKDEVSRGYFLMTRLFVTVAFCAVLIISTVVAINIINQEPVNNHAGVMPLIDNLQNTQLKDQSRAFMVSYMDQPLLREGKALIEETQRAGERLWQRFPLKPQIIPASYKPEDD